MAEDQVPVPSEDFSWSRSPEYELIYSNFYKTRLGSGEFILTFCSLRDAPGFAGVREIKEETAIAMPWTVLKMLMMSLKMTVDAIEHAVGPIAIPEGFAPDWEQAIAIARGLGLTTQPRGASD